MDAYETVTRFPHSEKARWLKGLLREAGHSNFVLSGPWNPDGGTPGRFSRALDTYELLLDASATELMVRMGMSEQRVGDAGDFRRLVPESVARRFANDLTTHALWTSIRRALAIEDSGMQLGHPPAPTPL